MQDVDFYGKDMPQEMRLERLESLNDKYHKLEPEALSKRWFDYRQTDSVTNTYLFAHYFRKINMLTSIKLVGEAKGQYSRGFRGNDVMAISRSAIGAWKGRQMADRLGIPYESYIHLAFRFTKDNIWQRTPNISQMSGEKMVDYISLHYLDVIESNPPMPTHERYTNQNYIGDQDQIDFQFYLVEAIENSKNMISTMSQYMINADLLNPKTVKMVYSQDQYEKVVKFHKKYN